MTDLERQELNYLRFVIFEIIKGYGQGCIDEIRDKLGYMDMWKRLTGISEWYKEKHKELGCVFGTFERQSKAGEFACNICNETVYNE